jgi:polysaccharide biosynthesis transport protein
MPEPPLEALSRRPDHSLPRMREPRPDIQHSSLNRNDILFALFKHKRKIVFCAVAGLVAAATAYFFYPPVYESQAKLLVRYVVERSAVDPIDNTRGSTGLGQASENVLGSEAEILTSWDLAVQTAEAIGPKRLLPSERAPTKEAAAKTIAVGLDVSIHKGSNIIFVSYKNHDPQLTTLVLNELVNRYFNKHLEVHRSTGAFDFVTQQTDQVRTRLNQTEDALKVLKGKAGIVSLADSTTALVNEAARTEEQLHNAESDLAEEQALVVQLGGVLPELSPKPGGSEKGADSGAEPSKSSPAKDAKLVKEGSSGEEKIPNEIVQQYQVLVSRLPKLREVKLDLLSKYTAQNQLVKTNQAEIDNCENQRRDLEKKYPDLPSKVSPIGSSNKPDLASEKVRLAGITAKKESLASRLTDIREQIKQLTEIAPQVASLERQRELEETNYKYFEGTLEKARVDEALDPSKIPNISAVQQPSPPMIVTTPRNKVALALAGAGLALGFAIALLNELVLNRTVRRSLELEKLIGASPLLSIPDNASAPSRLPWRKNGKASALVAKDAERKNLAPWAADHFIRPYCEAIRDRVGLYFELNNLTHRPKLVGVTGFSEAAGTSTLAAGLAAALSETGDGKVLLVDVNLGPQDVHSFFRGKPAYSLSTALQPAGSGAMDSAAENLYLATVAPPNAGPAQLGLKKFFDLMPNLKASDFDYIIFDMPPLGQTSPTLGMAPFMDKLLVMVAAGKDNRETVKRGYKALVSGRDNVSVLLNKVRDHAPKWMDGEL